ncbi:MAG TPA: BTAD domain-containing putative transcriptional regulator, partial [Solirubrobacteraceae bacterium]|nr:BTAD domain-containing putative transcriptional regulator [Solirubrobacteraceae bacterium]
MVRYAILGPVELREGERRVPPGGPRQVRLLALLLVNANRALSKDQLIDALWGDVDPAGAVKRLQVTIVRLRRTIDGAAGQRDGRLRTVAGGYLLAVQPGELDADVFERGVEEGRRALERGDPQRARDMLREALALWRGPALADVAFEEFALVEIRRLEELRLAALEARVDADLQLGEHGGLIGELESLMSAHPGRERFAGQLMRALYRCGRQGDALEVFARTRTYLSDELGLDPGPALKALQRAILEQSPSLEVERAAPAVELAPPARGAFPLPPPLVGDGEMFVGRAAEVGRLAGVYAEVAGGARRLVMLSGEPGAGKTRLAVEFARRAHDDGAIVLYGRCDEEALLPQQPFVEALRHYVAACPPHELTGRLRLSGELRWVVPEIADRVPELPHPLAGDPEGARSRLFEAVCSLLCQAARDRPLVLVLDDLHWADTSTLLLLKHLARDPREARLMVLGTYRGTELNLDDPLARLLSELGRERLLERLPVVSLDAAAVGEIVGDHAGEQASAELR